MKKVWKNICAMLATPFFMMDKDDHTINMLEEHMDTIESKLETHAQNEAAWKTEKAKLEADKQTAETAKATAEAALATEKQKASELQTKFDALTTSSAALKTDNDDLKAKLALRPLGGDPAGPGAGGADPKAEFVTKAAKFSHNQDADRALKAAGFTPSANPKTDVK